jgi:FAD/FMN-containing dehydrogenase
MLFQRTSRRSRAMNFSTVDVLMGAFLFLNSALASPVKSHQSNVTACLDLHNVKYSVAGSSDWTALTTPYNRRLVYVPAVVTIPTTPDDVTWSVKCAAASSLKVQARGGGHSYASYSSGGQNGSLIIEMENFSSITVDSSKLLPRRQKS